MRRGLRDRPAQGGRRGSAGELRRLRHFRRGGVHRAGRRQKADGDQLLRHGEYDQGCPGLYAPAAIPFQAYYSATKAAINAWTAALANEVRPYGITVTAIQPGDIKTGFTAAREKSIAGDEAYGGRISKSVAKMEHDEQNGMDPGVAGAYIAKIALKDKPKPVYTIGFSYKAICVLLKLLPCRLSNWLIGKLYA